MALGANLPHENASFEKCWWNTNVPQEQWTTSCPMFLRGQSQKNIGILSTRDEDHPRLSWSEVKDLIDTNHIDRFHRMPSDLRRYKQYCHHLKERYGSVLYFMQHTRLNWHTINPSTARPFSNELDYKILYNDWPYAIDTNIAHVVVWTKFALEDDPETSELTDAAKTLVEDFVSNTFCNRMSGYSWIDRDDIRWFKNWRSLRSVQALEHFHVMLYNPPAELIQKVTNNDRPICERVQETT